ncbi:MAG: DUF4417 domain-containing protein [Planctomycetia bacterium]|nr:DUF4417 domain-containing protein [Planctomycetia bacterium]
MIKGLNEFEKFYLIRPLPEDCKLDRFSMPFVKKTEFSSLDWEQLRVVGVQNASAKTSDRNTMVLMFNYDQRLEVLWERSLKKIPLFQGFAAVATPDFSLYPCMNENVIRNNIFKSRWIGVTFQSYGITVLPTVGWASPDTYDICFSGLEPGSIVVVSTLGCLEHTAEFLDGFREMKRRLKPPLIIVYGKMIKGMTGTFLNYRYNDLFCSKQVYGQKWISGLSRYFTIPEEVN